MGFLIRVFVVAAVSFGLAHLLGGVHVTDFWTAIVFAFVLALLNMFIKPLLVLFTLPVTFFTLGLFLFVINALVVLLASKFVDGFTIDSFWWALLFSIILSIITSAIDRKEKEDRRRAQLTGYSIFILNLVACSRMIFSTSLSNVFELFPALALLIFSLAI